MLKIAICDDDRNLCKWMTRIICSNEEELAQNFDITTYSKGEDMCKDMADGKIFDVIFLDIILGFGGMDGVDVGRYIRDILRNYAVRIVYISNTTEYALELFENHPFHFLVKPLDTAQVIGVLRKILQASMENNHSFQFTVGKQCYIVKCSDIIYAASSLRKIVLHTTDGVYEFYGSLSEIIKRLPEADFALVHQSYLINWLHVRHMERDKVKMSDLYEVPISRTYRKEVRSRYLQRMRWMQ